MRNSPQVARLLESPVAELQARVDRVYSNFRDLVAPCRLLAGGRGGPRTYPIYSTPAPPEVFHALRLFHIRHSNWQTCLTKVPWWKRLLGERAHWDLHFARADGRDVAASNRSRRLWRV
jgi:hypothetical protein